MKTYVGDGVYLEYDNDGDFILTTENGLEITNRIVLEPEVWRSLAKEAERMKRQAHETEAEGQP